MTTAGNVEERQYDLAVIGGGMAGICASIAAARLGLKVALINDRPVLGGNASSEIRVPIGGADHDFRWARESGIIEELRIEDRFRNHAPIVSGKTNSIWDMVLWEWATREPNMDLYLNTSARTAILQSKNRIAKIACEQLGTERTFHMSADLFIDASGDGRIGSSAGAEFRMGREPRREFGESIAPEDEDKKTLGTSLMFRAVDLGRPVKFERPDWAEEYPTEDALPFRGHGRMDSGHWWIELGGSQNTILDNEQIRDQLWRCLFGVWDHIKNKPAHGAENLALEWVGSVPGKRESRRFIGDYILTQHDVESMARFPDAVAYGGWPIDLHPPDGIRSTDPPADMHRLPGPYTIPFRSLYSKNIDNLMMSGRNISVSHVALGTTRLMATGAVEGEATGTAAYLCKKHGVTPRELGRTHIKELQQLLLRDDCYIPGVKNDDADDLARKGKAVASSEMELEVTQLKSFVKLDAQLGQIMPLSQKRLDRVELFLKSTAQDDQKVALRLRQAKSWWDTSSNQDVALAESKVAEGERWIGFDLGTKITPGFYRMLVDPAPGIEWGFSDDEPIGVQRTQPGPWRRLGGSYLFRTVPPSKPYGAQNVLSGVSRPEGWTNIWISDPRQGLPQTVEVQLASEAKVGRVIMTFDTDLDDLISLGPVPKCVKSYVLSCMTRKGWKRLAEVGENHHRRVVHSFKPVQTGAVKVKIQETWGAPSARIYEIRAY